MLYCKDGDLGTSVTLLVFIWLPLVDKLRTLDWKQIRADLQILKTGLAVNGAENWASL